MSRRRFDEKNEKTNPLVNDDLHIILDSEDTTTVIIDGEPVEVPKVKTKKHSDIGGGGGSGHVFHHELLVDPTAAPATGKIYTTYAAALAYAVAQGVGEVSKWRIKLPAGEFSENIELHPYVGISGDNTVLTGTLTSTIMFYPGLGDIMANTTYVQGCIIKKLDLSNIKTVGAEWSSLTTYAEGDEIYCDDPGTGVRHYFRSLTESNLNNDPYATVGVEWEDIDAEIGMPVLYAERCFFDISTFVKGVTLPSVIVAVSCNLQGGDFTGNVILYAYRSMYLGGQYPAYNESFAVDSLKAVNCQIYSGEFSGGKFTGCLIEDSSGYNVTFNAGRYTFEQGGVKGVALPVLGSYNSFYGVMIDKVDFDLGPSEGNPVLDLTLCGLFDTSISYEEEMSYFGTVIVRNCSGKLTVVPTVYDNLVVRKLGCLYDNSASGLAAVETNAAIDELASLIPPVPIEAVFQIRGPSDHRWSSAIYIPDLIKNPDRGMDVSPYNGNDSFMKCALNKNGFSNAASGSSEVGGITSIAGMKAYFGVVSLGTPNITITVSGDKTGVFTAGLRILLTPYPTLYPSTRTVVDSSYLPGPATTLITFASEISDKVAGVIILVPYDSEGDSLADASGLRAHAFNVMSYCKGTDVTVIGKHAETVGDSNIVMTAVSRAVGVGNACGSTVYPLNSVDHIRKRVTADDLDALPVGTLCKIVTVGIDGSGNIVAVSTYCTVTHFYGGYAWLYMLHDYFNTWEAGMVGLTIVIKSFIASMDGKYYGTVGEGLQVAEGLMNIVTGFCGRAEGLLCESDAILGRAAGYSGKVLAEAFASEVSGSEGRADFPLSRVLGAGSEEFVGDRQSIEVNLKGSSNDEGSAGVPLTVSYTYGVPVSSELVMPEFTVWRFSIEALMCNSVGDSFGQTIRGICRRGSEGSVLVDITYDSPNESSIGLDAEVIVSCDENGLLRVAARTGLGMLCWWMANVRIVQITDIPM